jgi:hypothetical protein
MTAMRHIGRNRRMGLFVITTSCTRPRATSVWNADRPT